MIIALIIKICKQRDLKLKQILRKFIFILFCQTVIKKVLFKVIIYKIILLIYAQELNLHEKIVITMRNPQS